MLEIRPGDVRSEFHDRMQHVEAGLAAPYAANARRAFAVIEGALAPSRVTVGGFFQAVLAPLGARVLPYRALQRVTARYFGLRR